MNLRLYIRLRTERNRARVAHKFLCFPALAALLTCLTLTSLCEAQAAKKIQPNVSKQPFGKMDDGTQVDLYTLTNAHGVEARITNYGGIVVSLKVPDRTGKLDDVVLGYDNLDGYLKNNGPYMGALIGRYANRIAKGRWGD